MPDPAAAATPMSDADLACIRRKIPFLADFSNDFIRSKPMETLLKIETTSIKIREMERVRDADDRLASNKMALSTTSRQVKAGPDNRWTILHPARFFPGAACSAAKLWLAAREVIGLTGPPPLGNYDLASVGLGGASLAKAGWSCIIRRVRSCRLKCFRSTTVRPRSAGVRQPITRTPLAMTSRTWGSSNWL